MCSASRGYPAGWPSVAMSVKEEAGWRCERCGAPHDPAVGYCLTVHHLDGDRSNCSRENLEALCQRCHLRAQRRLALYGPEDGRQMRLGGGREGVAVWYGRQAAKGVFWGLFLGLSITFGIGLVGVVLAHLCVWPVAPWCGW
jgi:hypothetical protein